MAQAHRMTDAHAAKLFVEGGRAVFTVVSTKTGVRFTYRLKLSKDEQVKFASVRVGPSYDYIGWYRNGELGKGVRTSAKSKLPNTSLEFMALEFALKNLGLKDTTGDAPYLSPSMEFWHEGKCGCCGRALTDPKSITRGIGPDCWERYLGRLAA